MPDPAVWVAKVVKEYNIDVVIDCEFDRIGCDRCCGGDQDGIYFVCRNLKCFIVGLHEETVLGLLEVRSAGVDYELHGYDEFETMVILSPGQVFPDPSSDRLWYSRSGFF